MAVVQGEPGVVLGFNAPWAFAPGDQTSPALAADAGALTDLTLHEQPVTELRIHGVSGSDGPTMLEHPHTLQVAGDTVAGFYRRWSPDGPGRPSVRWKLEAYSWGGMTEAPLASASWLLLAPFMMYNVAYFMLPPARGHQIARVLLRVLALAATVQLISAAASVLMSTVAWQAGGLPAWMGWYGKLTAGWRIAAALGAIAVIVAILVWLSVTTASKYENRTSSAQPKGDADWPLTQPGFWKGGAVVVRRQRALHAAAACASAALIAALDAGHLTAARWVVGTFAAVVLGISAISVALPMADRDAVVQASADRPRDDKTDRWYAWCCGVLVAAVAALVAAAVATGFSDRSRGPQTGALPGLTGFLAVLLTVQMILLVLLTAVVSMQAGRARAAEKGGAGATERSAPFLGGNLAVLITVLGFLLGGLLSAVINVGVTRLLGLPVPSGFRFPVQQSQNALTIPWPIYTFGAVALGLVSGAVVAAIWLYLRFLRNSRKLRSQVATAYTAAYTQAADGGQGNSNDATYAGNRASITRAWAAGQVVDDAGAAGAFIVGAGLIAVLAAEVAAAVAAGPAGHLVLLGGEWHTLASVVALSVVVTAGMFVGLLRQAYTDPAKRKSIGALWDVGTFWPRAVHPLAPPCYAERAIPEVVDRIRLLTPHPPAKREDLPHSRELTVPAGPVLLTGYSQGSVIAPAVIAQLGADDLAKVALLTLACPAQRLYGRAFPAFFGARQLTALGGLLGVKAGRDGRWKNLCRRSDYIGSWVIAEPSLGLGADGVRREVDQPCMDPVILVGKDATPPPIHRHSNWWQDPRTNELGAYLVSKLAAR